MKHKIVYNLFILLLSSTSIFSQYKDEKIILKGDDLINSIEEQENVIINDNSIELANDALEGGVMFKPQSSTESFNQGLPSWNGFAEEGLDSSFKIQMRFKNTAGWQRWVTVGFWDKEIWEYYGYTTFSGGKVDVDYVKINSYINEFQFQVIFKRTSTDIPAPSIKQLSFIVSDSRTTDNVNIANIVADNPPAIFYDTDFIYQYAVDDDIGGSICSPSSTAMIIRSYGINVDAYDFAVKTRDLHWMMYGVWPRNVQHAHMHGLRGNVSRYRTWSEAYEVLANGGRIAMSLGKPLYKGHLIMLAGFDEDGNPILHDPGSRNGYKRQYDKTKISQSWFNKGGISYTFYLEENLSNNFESYFEDVKIYPNPASEYFTIEVKEETDILLINSLGQVMTSITISNNTDIDLSNFTSGIYFIQLKNKQGNKSTRKLIVK